MPRDDGTAGSVNVWDVFVRLFHWSLVAAFFVAYFTEDEVMALHVWAGYAVGGLVVLRVVWGFVGTGHARFSDFLFGPFAASRYLRDLIAFRARRRLGHSPAGGFMVFLLLAGCVAIVASGLATYGAAGHGPLKGYVGRDTAIPSLAMVRPALAAEVEHERKERHAKTTAEKFFGGVHEILANLVLTLVLLHIAGVGLASLAHHENLVRSMVTGRKRPL
jgi:cytochrome b